jgi:hypothetical protein
MIHCLEYLIFTMPMSREIRGWGFSLELALLVARLEDQEVRKSLKVLIIAVEAQGYPNWDDAALSLACLQEWDKLDGIQWNSTLQKVHVCLDSPEVQPDASRRLQSLLQPHLSRLTKRGIFSVGLDSVSEIETRAWYGAWH